ncbi:MAG: sodium:proton antiporter [Ruminococcaceae bacterium]|nr:sodium:proton antiporter [Oscillospiraceae bacterium]
METLLCLSIAMAAGLLVSRVTKKLGLPSVTAYLVAGILVGPYGLGLLGIKGVGFTSLEDVETYSLLSQVALGFIAFAIGNEFRLPQLKKIGKQATIIAFAQALTATLLVDAALIGLYFIVGPEIMPLPVAITLGAVATATAPAATLMVVRQYKAKGELTDLLLPIVALDDAIGLMVFAVSFGIARALSSGAVDVISIIVNPVIEIVASLVLGLVMGLVFNFAERLFESNSKRLAMSITFVMLTVALSMLKFDIPTSAGTVKIGFSSLLVCMMLGTVFCNLSDFSEEIMGKTDRWTVPLFALFFVISGAELELSVFTSLAVVGIGVLYIVSRSLGKYFGACFSAKIAGCKPSICKYLGVTLLPQAGVALGMTITAAEELPEHGSMIRNIVLFAVLVYELVGPMLTKIALTKAGDIVPKTEKKSRIAAAETK